LRALVKHKIAHFKEKLSRLFELTLVLVGLDHVASFIVNADDGVM